MQNFKKILGVSVASTVLAATVVGCGTSTAPQNNGGNGGGTSTGGQTSTLDTIKQRGKLIAGVKYDTNLFGLKNPQTGKVEGFDVDIAKALGKKILGDPSKVELKEVTSSTRINLLKNGDIDLIAATMTITEDRKKEVNFSDVYFKAGQSLLVPKNSKITGIQDLNANTKVIAVKGSTSVKNIKEKAPKAQVLEFPNYADAFTALKSGKGDVLTTDNAILLGMQKQDPNFHLVGGLFTDEPYGIAVKKGDDAFTQYINDFLKELKSSGEYDTLYKKWFGKAPSK